MIQRIAAIMPCAALCVILALSGCHKSEELSLEELEARNTEGVAEILAKTTSKPWRGEDFTPGTRGGSWISIIKEEPKTFNYLMAEKDSASSAIMATTVDYLVDYDSVRREWKPRIASFEIVVDENAGTLQVVYTLRDDLYWSYYQSVQKFKVTSDDVVFWYNEISGDPEMQSSGYYQQFVTMSDGSEKRVTIQKIDNRRFAFQFPRIVAEPLLATNMDFGPRHIYEPAKQSGGAEAVKALNNISIDPKTLPSMGEWFITEYSKGQRLVFARNGDYWRKDSKGVSVPYYDETIARIIPDENTQLLLFKNGNIESYGLRPEDLDELVLRGDGDYTVFNAEGSLGASFWTFNQNAKHKGKATYDWFTQKAFRQAMSCLLNRERIIAQVYRGLAESKLTVFPEPNPYYNPAISNRYLYDPERAAELLASIGIKRDSRGVMRDAQKRAVEFDLLIRSESSINNDIASIIRDELSRVGIKLNIRVLDFQKLVDEMLSTYDWDSALMGLSGSNIFPSQGSNTWPSSGNLHLWYPNQEKPATEWEARIDYLYNEGCYTIDLVKAQAIWDELQTIVLEECPMIYLLRSRTFWALNNRWDMTNVYYDNLNGNEISFVFLK
jgi:peptide/nickel transport system substrate-binding protein